MTKTFPAATPQSTQSWTTSDNKLFPTKDDAVLHEARNSLKLAMNGLIDEEGYRDFNCHDLKTDVWISKLDNIFQQYHQFLRDNLSPGVYEARFVKQQDAAPQSGRPCMLAPHGT